MNAEKEWYIHKNREETGYYHRLNFADAPTLMAASEERDEIIRALEGKAVWGYRGTKTDVGRLSPGCRHCGSGTWSCLFINGLCNAGCFYCPAPQDREDVPTTQTVDFPDVDDYIRYLKKFHYKGVSISGGEPFLTFDKTLSFITRIRQEMGEEVYLWLYTNGILATKDKLWALRKAGLNEIRFDIGATGYRTDKVEMAIPIMDAVTVEIPAVPEEFETLKHLVVRLQQAGLSYLNLHQIRCTPHNYEKLMKRGYTFLHGPRITVLESELTALRLIRYAREQGLSLPVNYCSSIYKYRYQRMAARKRYAPVIANPWEEVTDTGMIRTLAVKGPRPRLEQVSHDLLRGGVEPSQYHFPDFADKLYFRKAHWDRINFEDLDLVVSYSRAFMLPGVSYRNMFREVPLTSRKSIIIERTPVVKDYIFTAGEIRGFRDALDPKDPLCNEQQQAIRQTPFLQEALARIYEYERPGYGLPEYY
jgi:pyruvate formate-lyase activating enzyme-like uncharacterized protein